MLDFVRALLHSSDILVSDIRDVTIRTIPAIPNYNLYTVLSVGIELYFVCVYVKQTPKQKTRIKA